MGRWCLFDPSTLEELVITLPRGVASTTFDRKVVYFVAPPALVVTWRDQELSLIFWGRELAEVKQLTIVHDRAMVASSTRDELGQAGEAVGALSMLLVASRPVLSHDRG